MQTIIGITGTLGAGKGAIVNFLIEKKDFAHYSARSLIIEHIKKRGMPVNRDSMVVVANDLREKHGPDFIARELFKRAEKEGKDSVLESLRTSGEINKLREVAEEKQLQFFMFGVDADPKTRYERAVKRKSSTDNISYKEFLENERREMKGDDPTKQNLSKCMEMSNHIFYNNGTLKELYEEVEKVLGDMGVE